MMNKYETFSVHIACGQCKKCWKAFWITEVVHKVITFREEEVVNVDDVHGAVTMRQMDFSWSSELGLLTISSLVV